MNLRDLALSAQHTQRQKWLLILSLIITLYIPLLSQTKVFAASVGDGSIDSTVTLDDRTTNGPTLSDNDNYGSPITYLGDLNGDGVGDIAVGATGDDTGGTDRGAFYIHFLNSDGSIKSKVKIDGNTTNGATLSDSDFYGNVTYIGDLNGDGVGDLAVGASWDDAGGQDKGAVYIHFMNTDGSIDSTVKIDDTTSNGPTLSTEDYYGTGIASLGDLNGDGVRDIAVGARGDDAGGDGRGAVHIHFMNTDGSIDSTVEINSDTTNGPTITNSARYGSSLSSIGDLNGDGVADLAVGATFDSQDSLLDGSLHIHFMNTDGSIDSTVEINSATVNGPNLIAVDLYGYSVTSLGDLNGDGVSDLAVGAIGDDAGGNGNGTTHIHFMNTDGSIDSTVEINGNTTNGPTLTGGAAYGSGLASVGDLDGNGISDLAVGAYNSQAGGEFGALRGSVYIHFMHKVTTASTSVAENKFSEDKRCHYAKPPEITWIKITPEEENGISGVLLTWTQYSANKVTIKIEDGTNSFPWKVDKTSNDGHEFLPNVYAWQELKVKPYNHCKGGEYSIPISYNLYPYGWYND